MAGYSDFRALDFERSKSYPNQVAQQQSAEHLQTVSRMSQLSYQPSDLFYMTNGKTLPRVAQYVNTVL